MQPVPGEALQCNLSLSDLQSPLQHPPSVPRTIVCGLPIHACMRMRRWKARGVAAQS